MTTREDARFPSTIGRCLRAVLALLAPALAVTTAPAAGGPARHVVVVVIDGARYSETFSDPLHQWCPRQVLDLAPQACVVPDFRNLGVTLTMPGTSAVMCGLWQPLANDGSEPSHVPSLLESWRIATGAPASDTRLIATKSKILTLAQSDHPASSAATASATTLGANDVAATTIAISALHADRPTLLVLQLGDTDVAGHLGSWTLYTASIRRADSLVAVLWQRSRAMPRSPTARRCS